MVPNNANNVNLKENGKDQSKCSLTYHVSSSSFTMTQQDDRLFPKGSEVILIKPPFKLFVTGPKYFLPPLLHLQMGMVNQAFDNFEAWVDDYVEVIPLAEKEDCKRTQTCKRLA